MITKQTSKKDTSSVGKQKTYNDIVTFLDQNWGFDRSAKTIERMKQLDKALGSPSKDLNTVAIAGTNGKGLTIHFVSRLLKQEGVSVGTFVDPHILKYNERFTVNGETISDKTFTQLANEVVQAAEKNNIAVTSREILTMMALMHFKNNKVDAAILEVTEGGKFDPTNICTHKVAAITRVTADDKLDSHKTMQEVVEEITGLVSKETWIVSGDQNKSYLQFMQKFTEKLKGNWAMPIRKLAPLAYPFEQLHGRSAAVAERVASLYIEHVVVADGATVIQDSLLAKQKGRRGRPTIEAKRQMELNPKRTIEQFWSEVSTALPARFQLIEQEKPTVLLDNASNFDAFENLLLGIRLMNYKNSIKGLTLIVGTNGNELNNIKFLKLIRYFFKKTSGQIFLCPLTTKTESHAPDTSWDVTKVANEFKNMKVKARAFESFKKALKTAQDGADEKHGLIVVSGCQAIVSEYWKNKDLKKI